MVFFLPCVSYTLKKKILKNIFHQWNKIPKKTSQNLCFLAIKALYRSNTLLKHKTPDKFNLTSVDFRQTCSEVLTWLESAKYLNYKIHTQFLRYFCCYLLIFISLQFPKFLHGIQNWNLHVAEIFSGSHQTIVNRKCLGQCSIMLVVEIFPKHSICILRQKSVLLLF